MGQGARVRRRRRARRRDPRDAPAVRVPALDAADDPRRRPRPQPPHQARARAAARAARRGRLRSQERRRRHPRDRVLRAGAAADPRGQAARAARRRGTLASLDALQFAGLVTDAEHATLVRAYRWLRHAEHVLQLDGGLQTQTIPEDDHARLVFARRLGYTASTTGVAFVVDLERHTSAVSRLFATLGTTSEASDDVTPAAARRAGGGRRERGARAHGLCRSDGGARRARAHRDGARARRCRRARTIDRRASAPALLDQIVSAQRGSRSGAARVRRSDRAARRRVVDVAPARREPGAREARREHLRSERVPRAHARRFAGADRSAGAARAVGAVAHAAAGRRGSARARRPGGRRRRRGRVERGRRGEERSRAARRARRLRGRARRGRGVRRADDDRRGVPARGARDRRGPARARPARESAHPRLLGLGKLGGYELGYAADLDVVFVHADTDEEDSVEWYARVGQRLLGALRQRTPNGRLYEIDTRLRPSGSQGLLVSSLSGWRRYHAADARLWERQALVKLRPVAGDVALGEEVRQLAVVTAYGETARARARDRRRDHPDARSPHRARAGWAPIALRRSQGERGWGDGRRVRGPVPAARLRPRSRRAAHDIDDGGVARRGGVRRGAGGGARVALAGRLSGSCGASRNRLRVVHDQPVHRLPESRDELDKLARRSGFPDGRVLREHVERWQHEIRGAYLRLLGA